MIPRASRLAVAALLLATAAGARAAGPRADRNAQSPFGVKADEPARVPVASGGGDVYVVTFLFNFSTSFGPTPLSNAQLSVDAEHHEVYVTGDGPVRVYNDSGMETFAFDEDPALGVVLSVAATESGELVALASRDGKARVVRCSYRGELLGTIEPRGVPEEFAGFAPTVLRYRDGKVYLADQGGMRIVVLDVAGTYLAGYDIAEKLKESARRDDLGLRGFNVDREGNILFTIQPLFSAYTMSPDGDIRAFGVRGSAPGKFNIVGGIARDDAGNYYVTDILKSAVLVFDKSLTWRGEFGYRGTRPHSLVAPEDVAAAGDRVYVSSRARRGVTVFRVATP